MLTNNILLTTPVTINAVAFCEHNLTIAMLTDSIARIDRKLKNETATKQIAALKEKREKAVIDKEAHEKALEKVRPDYNATLATMTAPNEKGFANSEQAVKNVLNLIASAKDSKLEKYALSAQVWDNSLANAFDTIHLVTSMNVTTDGNTKASKAVKNSYKNASDLIDKTLRDAFSLPIVTDANSAFRCKFDNSTLKMLHEAYITGLSNKYSTDKDNKDIISFESTKMRALISSKKDKNGNVSYNYSKFNTVIAKLVIAKIAQA